jgi:hypothetical protein
VAAVGLPVRLLAQLHRAGAPLHLGQAAPQARLGADHPQLCAPSLGQQRDQGSGRWGSQSARSAPGFLPTLARGRHREHILHRQSLQNREETLGGQRFAQYGAAHDGCCDHGARGPRGRWDGSEVVALLQPAQASPVRAPLCHFRPRGRGLAQLINSLFPGGAGARGAGGQPPSPAAQHPACAVRLRGQAGLRAVAQHPALSPSPPLSAAGAAAGRRTRRPRSTAPPPGLAAPSQSGPAPAPAAPARRRRHPPPGRRQESTPSAPWPPAP